MRSRGEWLLSPFFWAAERCSSVQNGSQEAPAGSRLLLPVPGKFMSSKFLLHNDLQYVRATLVRQDARRNSRLGPR